MRGRKRDTVWKIANFPAIHITIFRKINSVEISYSQSKFYCVWRKNEKLTYISPKKYFVKSTLQWCFAFTKFLSNSKNEISQKDFTIEKFLNLHTMRGGGLCVHNFFCYLGWWWGAYYYKVKIVGMLTDVEQVGHNFSQRWIKLCLPFVESCSTKNGVTWHITQEFLWLCHIIANNFSLLRKRYCLQRLYQGARSQ